MRALCAVSIFLSTISAASYWVRNDLQSGDSAASYRVRNHLQSGDSAAVYWVQNDLHSGDQGVWLCAVTQLSFAGPRIMRSFPLFQSCHLGECQANSVIQDLTSRASRRRHPTRTPSPTSSTTSSTGPSRVLVPGSSQSRLSGGQRDLDNTIPTVPQSMIRGRVGRPSKARREQLRRRHRFRSGRGRSRPRNKSRRKGGLPSV